VEIVRRGVAVNLTLETLAAQLLRAQCESKKSLGKHVSDLVYQEEHRRIEARRLREQDAETAPEALTAS
jgi:hypothetical protein